MRYLTDEQTSKIHLIDEYISSLSVDELTKMLQDELVASKLKGNENNSSIIFSMYQSIQDLSTSLTSKSNEVILLRQQVDMMKMDMRDLIKVVNSGVSSYDSFSILSSLKSRNGIY